MLTATAVLSEPHTGNVFSFLGGLFSGNAWTPLPLSGAALNSLGLPSKGIDAALASIAAFRERHGIRPQRAGPAGTAGPSGGAAFPIGVSIMGHPAHAVDPARKLGGIVECVRRALPLADFIWYSTPDLSVQQVAGEAGARLTRYAGA